MKYGIQYQPFARNIEVGRLNKAQDRFVGEKEDVTAMAVGAVAKWVVEEEEGAVVIDDDAGNTYHLFVTKSPSEET